MLPHVSRSLPCFTIKWTPIGHLFCFPLFYKELNFCGALKLYKQRGKNGKNKIQSLSEYDAEYNGYVADVPSLPGCMVQEKSEEEVLANIQEAIKGYLKVAQKKHMVIPSEETRFVEVTV